MKSVTDESDGCRSSTAMASKPMQHFRRRAQRTTACACPLARDPPDLRVLLILKRHSGPFRQFFEALWNCKGDVAVQLLGQMQRQELLQILSVCDQSAESLHALFNDVFGSNPSYPYLKRRWQSGQPHGVFQDLALESKIRQLLESRVKECDFPSYWEFPGGDISHRRCGGSGGDDEEEPSSAAVREAFEETGYLLVPTPQYGLDEVIRWGRDLGNTNHMIVCGLPPSRELSDGPQADGDPAEVAECRWVSAPEALSLMRDPNNSDYPNFLRKVLCYFYHATFSKGIAAPSITRELKDALEAMRRFMEAELLSKAQEKELQRMISVYNAWKSKHPPPPAPERETRKQEMLQFVLQCSRSNSQVSSQVTYGAGQLPTSIEKREPRVARSSV
eukprot:RCo042217